jgi:hypothetical protein
MLTFMKPQNPTAFPAEVFIAAGIPRDAKVSLTVCGHFSTHGVIKRRYLTNEVPDELVFREIAGDHEFWEVTEATVEVADEKSGGIQTLEFKFPEENVAQEKASTESWLHRVAITEVPFVDAELYREKPVLVSDLAFITHHDGQLWLDGKPLHWRTKHFGWPEYWVEHCGERCGPQEFWWGDDECCAVCDALLDIQEHAFVPGVSISRIEAVALLRDEPQRWAEVVSRFIRRHGRQAAGSLLGTENLDAVLRCELWERLTIESARKDDPLQLRLWSDAPKSSADQKPAGNSL